MSEKEQVQKPEKDPPKLRSKSDRKDSNGRKGKASRTPAEPNGNKASKPTASVAKKQTKATEPPLVVEGIRHSVKIEKAKNKGTKKSAAKAPDTKTGKQKETTATTAPQPDKPQPQTTTAAANISRYGTALLAQAAMQSSSLALPGAPLTLPLVTPPTLPVESGSPPPSSPPAGKRRGIPHTYRDYSNEPDSPGFVRKKTGGVTKPFPEKLHELLSTETESQDVVGWLPHGRAFIVRKPHVFTASIMHKYFRQTKLTSFQRQLNLYGFRRITQGPDAGAYYHELFLKGRPQLCMRMIRQKVKGTGHKLPADTETEPNFYAMPTSPSSSGNSIQEESPGMQGLRGAANLLQGISAGLPPAAMLPKQQPQVASLLSSTYTTASTTNPQHWQYATAVARHESLVEKESRQNHGGGVKQGKKEKPPSHALMASEQKTKKNGDQKPPPKAGGGDKKDQSQGDNATNKP